MDLATSHPLRAIGLEPAALADGQPADLVLFRLEQDGEQGPGELTIEQTIAGGEVVNQRSA